VSANSVFFKITKQEERMKTLRKEREVKEAARRKELSKREPDGINQEETAKATEEKRKCRIC
jgi:hypothetical protein